MHHITKAFLIWIFAAGAIFHVTYFKYRLSCCFNITVILLLLRLIFKNFKSKYIYLRNNGERGLIITIILFVLSGAYLFNKPDKSIDPRN